MDSLSDARGPDIADSPLVPSTRLKEQIQGMVERHEDYIVDADGVDDSIHIVVNDFKNGVWLCEHHGECCMNLFKRVQRLD